jgi:hypothetical protein
MNQGLFLSLMIGPAVPVPAPEPVIDALTAVQVIVSSGQRSGFQLTFAIGNSSLLNQTLLPAGYFDPAVRVIIVVTINGMPTVLMDGVITRQDLAPSNNAGQSTLTITGEDLTRMMDLDDLSGTQFPVIPAEDRVARILASYATLGIIPNISPSPIPDEPHQTDRIPGQQGTDLGYINKLAADVGYVFYLDPGPLPGTSVAYWGPEVKVGVPQPALSIDMDAQTNVESLSFGFDGFSKTAYTLRVLDEDKKTIRIESMPEVTLLNPPLGAKPLPAYRIEEREAGPLTADQVRAQGLAKASQSADVISASGQLDVLRYGQPLKARQLVGVRGVGLTYDGLYYVQSVTHNIKRGEYKQSFTLSRNALISITPTLPT